MESGASPTSLRDLAATSGWRDSLAEIVDPERLANLLAQADALREGDDAERAIALSAYGALHRGVNPATIPGCARAAWVIDTLKAVDLRFVPILRAIQESALDRIVRLRSRVAYGAHLVDAGENAEAERMYISVLQETRGKGEIPERAAVLALCRLYRAERRLFEAFVLARHAVRLFEAAGDPIRVILTLEVVLGCLGAMSEWDEFDSVMRRAKALLAETTHEQVAWWDEDLDVLQFDALAQRGRTEEALRWLDAREKNGPKWPGHASCDERWVMTRRARALCISGALDEAAELIAKVRALPPFELSSSYRNLQLDALCAVRRGDTGRAVTTTRELLDVPLEEIVAICGTGSALQWFDALAQALRDAGEDELARRGFDRAAACAVERIRQTEVAVRVFPELGGVSPRDQALLTRTRLRFASEHRELLRSLAGLFERAAAAGEPLVTAVDGGELTRVCAWCARVELEGEWVPIGHLLPLDGVLNLTHGMCPDCGADMRAQLLAS